MTPLLIYDGDCGFCVWWVRYWRELTGERVRYAPYQQVAADYPQIALDEFRRAVQFVAGDGRRIAAGAEASFEVLAQAPGRGYALRLYRYLPGFAPLSEAAYRFVAAHRGAALRVGRALWGRDRVVPRHERTAALFLRALALIYLAAFVSLGVQIAGLAGRDGLLPLADYLRVAAARYPPLQRYWLFPTVFWFDASDAALQAACAAGALAALALLLGRLQRASLALGFVLYLSLFYAGQTFMSFQWDLLLLETGCIALVLCRRPALLVWTLRWLVFRLLLMSGLVKWLGDPGWRELSALRHHFETQPLPTPLAWWAARLPDGALAFATAATLVVELLLPFFVLLPRRPRLLAAAGIVAFQLAILATGNYGFFNLLVLALCIALLDDAHWRRLSPRRIASTPPPAPRRGFAPALGFVLASLSLGMLQIAATLRPAAPPGPILDALAPLRIVNRYGPFASLTAERAEIVIEGTRDGVHWREYGFRYKPGDPRRAPSWNLPHQPRLDWQMWFAALGTQAENPWFSRLLLGLLRNTPEVVGLLGDNPFAAAPPLAVRAQLYDYRFADAAQRAAGAWWTRRPSGLYYPEVGLEQLAR